MARTIGGALPHKLPSMANAFGLLLGRGVWVMIGLLDVNTYAVMVGDYISQNNKKKSVELIPILESKLSDRQAVLSKLEERASESGSDNSWNKYESVDEAYAYGLELKSLLEDYLYGDEDYENIEWQVADLVNKTRREWSYRMERAQW